MESETVQRQAWIEPEMKPEWYLLRTKAGEERRARDQVTRIADDVLLPLAKVRVRRWGKMVESVAALFPCYLFAQFNMEREYSRLRYTRGIRGVVCLGNQPATIPDWIVEELRQRCAGGPIDLPRRPFLAGERVIVVDGPFREFGGIFERYLSGPERVAVLLSAMRSGARVVLPARMVMPLISSAGATAK